MKKILVIGGGAMGSAFTVPCIENNNEVIIKRSHSQWPVFLLLEGNSAKSTGRRYWISPSPLIIKILFSEVRIFNCFAYWLVHLSFLWYVSLLFSVATRQFNIRKPKQNRKWTPEEEDAIHRSLEKNYAERRVPLKDECLRAIELEPSLSGRSWRIIKDHVRNWLVKNEKTQYHWIYDQ